MLCSLSLLQVNNADANRVVLVCKDRPRTRVQKHQDAVEHAEVAEDKAQVAAVSGRLATTKSKKKLPKPSRAKFTGGVQFAKVECPCRLSISRGRVRDGVSKVVSLVSVHSTSCILVPSRTIRLSSLYSRTLLLPDMEEKLVELLSQCRLVSFFSCVICVGSNGSH
jgi:hypothetical protein